MTGKVGSPWEKLDLPAAITELALESFCPVSLVFVPFQIGGARTLVAADIAAELFHLEVDVREVLITHVGGCKSFSASRALVRPVPAMTPGVSLNAISVSMWVGCMNAEWTAYPAAEDITLRVVDFSQMFMQVVSLVKELSTRLIVMVGPLTNDIVASRLLKSRLLRRGI